MQRTTGIEGFGAKLVRAPYAHEDAQPADSWYHLETVSPASRTEVVTSVPDDLGVEHAGRAVNPLALPTSVRIQMLSFAGRSSVRSQAVDRVRWANSTQEAARKRRRGTEKAARKTAHLRRTGALCAASGPKSCREVREGRRGGFGSLTPGRLLGAEPETLVVAASSARGGARPPS